MPIPNRIRFINKRFTNRIMILIAGKRHSPIALLRHTGWKSGKKYEIPIMVEPTANGFIFALTYGTGVDWYRNIAATNAAELRWKGGEYHLSNQRKVEADKGREAFGRFKGAILRKAGVNDFIAMDSAQKDNF